jgi:hypothetical protein
VVKKRGAVNYGIDQTYVGARRLEKTVLGRWMGKFDGVSGADCIFKGFQVDQKGGRNILAKGFSERAKILANKLSVEFQRDTGVDEVDTSLAMATLIEKPKEYVISSTKKHGRKASASQGHRTSNTHGR